MPFRVNANPLRDLDRVQKAAALNEDIVNLLEMHACRIRKQEVDDWHDKQEVDARVDDIVAPGDCAEAYRRDLQRSGMR